MLEIKQEQSLDYTSILSNPAQTLKLVRIMMEGVSSRPKPKREKEQDVINLLSRYGFTEDEIRELIKTVEKPSKVVNLEKLNKNSRAYKNIKSHVEFLHNHEALESWITVAHIDYSLAQDGFHQWHYKNSEVVDVLSSLRGKKTNTYMSVNEFYSPYRNVLTLRYITAFYIDIDAHGDVEFDLKAVLKFLKKKYKTGILPPHSKLTFTGRGVQIYWKIELSPASNLWLWQIIQNYIIEALEDIKQDIPGHEVDKNCSDITRVFRVDDTWNLKAKCYSKNIEQNDNVYRMNQILEDFFKDKYIARKKRKNTKKTEIRLESENEEKKEWVLELNDKIEAKFRIMRQRRCEDLKTLLELRKNDLSKGHREYFLFIYAWTAVENITSETMIYRELASVNMMFNDPLTENEVRAIARKVFRKWSRRALKTSAKENTWSKATGRYTFRNRTIIQKLDITEEERKHFETIFWDKEEAKVVYNRRRNENKRKARRNENGLTQRQQKMADKYLKYLPLIQQGFGAKKIAKELAMSLNTVKYDIKQMKLKGLI